MASIDHPPADPSPIERVIDEGICIGCGVCRYAAPDHIALSVDEGGFIAARVEEGGHPYLGDVSRLCPMAGAGEDESEIAATLFPELPAYPRVGRVLSVAAVHVHDDGMRLRSSSGGLLTWRSGRLLELGLVDGIAHVGPSGSNGSDLLFQYRISRSPEDLLANAKSHYYPIHLAEVLDQITRSDDVIAVMGIPCFIKAVRNLASHDADIARRVRFYLGLICGHLKSKYFAESLAWQAGVDPKTLVRFDFRHKLPDAPASDYGFQAIGGPPGEERHVTRPMHSVMGSDWGHGMFKYKGCDFCDDVIVECADIAIGDAWLPKYATDYRGYNVVCFRDPYLRDLVDQGAASGELFVEQLTVDDLEQSQAAGLRHRNEGLAHRLRQRQLRGAWSPAKRVTPADIGDDKRKAIYDLRERIRDQSVIAYNAARQSGDIETFRRLMRPLIRQYRRAYLPHPVIRLRNRLRRILRRATIMK